MGVLIRVRVQVPLPSSLELMVEVVVEEEQVHQVLAYLVELADLVL
jgi:hypothetical protein